VQNRQRPLDPFVGRAAELARVAEVITRVEAGQPWLVAIEGDPGMGKTTLARRCLAEAAGVRVLWARGDQAEADLDFGIADQLMRGALLADGAGAPGSSFAVGARLLEVVAEPAGAATASAIVIDDLQWADRKSVEALTFMLRRLSVDPVIAIVTYRAPGDRLDETARRMLSSVENRLVVQLGGLHADEVGSLASVLRPGSLDDETVEWLHRRTGGHPLYLHTLLSEGFNFDPRASGRLALPRSLAAAIGGRLRVLPPETREILEMLAVLNIRLPIAQLGQAAEVGSPSAAIEPAVASGLVDWWPEEPSCPVAIRHLLVRDAIYAGITATRRRTLHARAASVVNESASWEHRVAALERPDEGLAAQLEQLAAEEAADGRLALAATHLQWAADISPARADRERRLLTAALHLMLAEAPSGLALREAVETSGPSPLRSCVLGTMAFSTGQLAEAERQFSEALAQAQDDPDSQPLAAMIANRLAGTYTLLGDGEKVMTFGRQALGTGGLDAAAASATRTLVAIGAAQVAGPRAALGELGHLDADAARVGPVDVDGLSFRGVFRLLAGDLDQAVTDMAASLRLARRGATLTLGLRAYFYLALAQYLAGSWDDVLLTAEQGFSAAAIQSRRYELPLLHLAAGCVPAGRGEAEEAERHAALAEEAAASLDYGQERVYAAMARALIYQASGDYLGMADALGPWLDEKALDGRSRVYAILWRPLLVEGLVGSGQIEQAAAALDQLRASGGQVSYLQPALAWLEGWLAEQRGGAEEALRIYTRGEEGAGPQSPVYTARLLLAHGRLLRRTGQRRLAVERLRRANEVYQVLRAAPFIARTEEELAACRLPGGSPAKKQSVLQLTSRETEVAHLVGKGLSNPEIAAELFISRKAVEYHLGNIYAKCGLRGRQQLRRFVEQWRAPSAVLPLAGGGRLPIRAARAAGARKPGELLGGHHRRSPPRQHDHARAEHGERPDSTEHVPGAGAQPLTEELDAQRDARERVDDEQGRLGRGQRPDRVRALQQDRAQHSRPDHGVERPVREQPQHTAVGQHVHGLLHERGVQGPHDGRGRPEQGGAAGRRAVPAEQEQHQHDQAPGGDRLDPLSGVRDVAALGGRRHDQEGGEPHADHEGGGPGPGGDVVVEEEDAQAQGEDQLQHQDRLYHRQRAEVQGERLEGEGADEEEAAEEPGRLADQIDRGPPDGLRLGRAAGDGEPLQHGAARVRQRRQDGEDDCRGHGSASSSRECSGPGPTAAPA
jgi:DNA-binding CsgD family transcriptional regulator